MRVPTFLTFYIFLQQWKLWIGKMWTWACLLASHFSKWKAACLKFPVHFLISSKPSTCLTITEQVHLHFWVHGFVVLSKSGYSKEKREMFHCTLTQAVSNSCLYLSGCMLTGMPPARDTPTFTLAPFPLHFLANYFLWVVNLKIAHWRGRQEKWWIYYLCEIFSLNHWCGVPGILCTILQPFRNRNFYKMKTRKEMWDSTCPIYLKLHTSVVEGQLFHFMFCTRLGFLSLERKRNWRQNLF